MTIHDIENMPATELKARREELITAGLDFAPADLSERYVQARLDAKLRDELLAEQGKTITGLEHQADDLLGRLEQLNVQYKAAKETGATLNAQLAEMTAELAQEKARVERLKVTARCNNKAVVGAAAILNAAISEQHVQDADHGV